MLALEGIETSPHPRVHRDLAQPRGPPGTWWWSRHSAGSRDGESAVGTWGALRARPHAAGTACCARRDGAGAASVGTARASL